MSLPQRIFDLIRTLGLTLLLIITMFSVWQNQIAIHQNDQAIQQNKIQLQRLNALAWLIVDIDEDTEQLKKAHNIVKDAPPDRIHVVFNDTMININNKTFIPFNLTHAGIITDN